MFVRKSNILHRESNKSQNPNKTDQTGSMETNMNRAFNTRVKSIVGDEDLAFSFSYTYLYLGTIVVATSVKMQTRRLYTRLC